MRTPSPRLVTAGLATLTIVLGLALGIGARTTGTAPPAAGTGAGTIVPAQPGAGTGAGTIVPAQPGASTALPPPIPTTGPYTSGPVQPIRTFSHRVHATVNAIPCLHCHAGTEKSQLAGVPAVATCVGCHLYLGRARQQPGVKQLFEYWDRKEPIPWVRVYYLPQFSQFKHKAHIRAGVTCQTCHGPVEKMDVVEPNQKVTMGWCIGCHTNTKHQAKLAQAPTDCNTCHY